MMRRCQAGVCTRAERLSMALGSIQDLAKRRKKERKSFGVCGRYWKSERRKAHAMSCFQFS